MDSQDKFGGTALHWAAYYGHKEIVTLLLENGANVALRRKSGGTAMTMARDHAQKEVIELLKQAGAKE